MLPLSGREFPASRDELVSFLTEGLHLVFHLPSGHQPVAAEGAGYPALDRLAVDVSGAVVNEEYRPRKPAGTEQPELTAARFEVHGHGVRHGQASFDFEMSATGARLAFERDEHSLNILYPVAAADGRFRVRIGHADVEALVLSGARAAAAAHGVTVETTQLALDCPGDRTAVVDLRVTGGKKLGFINAHAVISLRGRLTVDDDLNATLSDLSCHGEGMAGKVVAAMLHGHVKQMEGKTFALAALSLGSLRLHDLKMRSQDGLEVEGAFGG